MASFDLTDRVAIVTGGSDGIGKGIALAMAEAGADIVVAARQQQKIDAAVAGIKALGRRAVGVSVDVSDPAQIQRIADAAMGRVWQGRRAGQPRRLQLGHDV